MVTKNQKLALVGASVLGVIFLLPRGDSQKSGGGSNYEGFTETKPAVQPIINYQLPPVTINESSFSDYVPTDAPLSSTTKKESNSTGGSSSTPKLSVGNVQDYNSLPEGSATKKAFASQYPVTDEGNGLTSQPTYGLGAGGTKTYTSKPVNLPSNFNYTAPSGTTYAPTKKETASATPSFSWKSPSTWF